MKSSNPDAILAAMERFESAWAERVCVPDIRSYCSDPKNEGAQLWVQLAAIDLERRWKTSDAEWQKLSDATGLSRRPLIEDYLRLAPELAGDGPVPFELIRHEFEVRRDCGDPATPDEYRRRFPNCEYQLTELFCNALAVDRKVELPSDTFELHAAVYDSKTAIRDVVSNSQTPTHRSDSAPHEGTKDLRHPKPEGIEDSDWTPPPTDNPRRLGDYELIEKLGKGGMGVVYKARQVSANRLVALKLIRPEQLSQFLPEERDKALARFRTEVKAAAQLEHDHVVTVYDVGEIEGQSYYAMRYVHGGSLKDKLSEGPLKPEDAARYMEQVSLALASAHSHGILHRDLKPHNVMVDANTDRAMLADFGLAKLTDGDQQLTATEAAMGSPPYMSPEQTRDAGKVTTASDIYGIGATLYHLITGRPPFQAASAIVTMLQVQTKDPVLPRELNASIPKDLETICLKCLDKECANRYDSADVLANELARFQCGEPIQARPIGKLARAWRWCKRNPALAALCTTIAVVLLIGMLTTSSFAVKAEVQRRRADMKAELASKHERDSKVQEELAMNRARSLQTALVEVETQKEIAQNALVEVKLQRENAESRLQKFEWQLYAATLEKARRAWADGDIHGAHRYLDACRWDFRGWEHNHLHTIFSNRVSHHKLQDTTRVACISPDRTRLAVVTRRGELKLLNTKTHDELVVLKAEDIGFAQSLSLSTDGRILALAEESSDKGITIFDTSMRNATRNIKKARGPMALGPEGRQIVGARDHKWMSLWDTTTGEKVRDLESVEAQEQDDLRRDSLSLQPTDVEFSPDGQRVVACFMPETHDFGTIAMWDVNSGLIILKIDKIRQLPANIRFDATGKRFATSGVSLRNTSSGKPLHESDYMKMPGNTIIWDSDSGDLVQSFSGGARPMLTSDFSADGSRIVTGSFDGTIRIWEVSTGQELLSITSDIDYGGQPLSIEAIALDTDERQVITNCGAWSAAETREFKIQQDVADVSRITFSGDGDLILSASGQIDTWGEVKVLRAATGQEVATFTQPLKVTGAAFSPDGKQVVSAAWWLSKSSEISVWDLGTGRKLQSWPDESAIRDVVYASDGQHVLSICEVGGRQDKSTLKVWDVHKGKTVSDFELPVGAHNVMLGPSGKRLLMFGDFGEIVCFDVLTRDRALTFKGTTANFSADGAWLAGFSADGMLTVWDIGARKATHLLQLQKSSSNVVSVAFSPSTGLVAVSEKTGQEKTTVWKAANSEEIFSVQGTVIDFSPDGRQLITIDQEGVKIWNTRTTLDGGYIFSDAFTGQERVGPQESAGTE